MILILFCSEGHCRHLIELKITNIQGIGRPTNWTCFGKVVPLKVWTRLCSVWHPLSVSAATTIWYVTPCPRSSLICFRDRNVRNTRGYSIDRASWYFIHMVQSTGDKIITCTLSRWWFRFQGSVKLISERYIFDMDNMDEKLWTLIYHGGDLMPRAVKKFLAQWRLLCLVASPILSALIWALMLNRTGTIMSTTISKTAGFSDNRSISVNMNGNAAKTCRPLSRGARRSVSSDYGWCFVYFGLRVRSKTKKWKPLQLSVWQGYAWTCCIFAALWLVRSWLLVPSIKAWWLKWNSFWYFKM